MSQATVHELHKLLCDQDISSFAISAASLSRCFKKLLGLAQRSSLYLNQVCLHLCVVDICGDYLPSEKDLFLWITPNQISGHGNASARRELPRKAGTHFPLPETICIITTLKCMGDEHCSCRHQSSPAQIWLGVWMSLGQRPRKGKSSAAEVRRERKSNVRLEPLTASSKLRPSM